MTGRRAIAILVCAWAALALMLPAAGPATGARRLAPATPSRGSLLFVEGMGQLPAGARFVTPGAGTSLALADDALWFLISGPDRQTGVALRMSFPGANPRPHLEPFDRLTAQVSSFLGSDPAAWKAGLATWAGVRYRDLYPGIDLELTGQNGRLAWRLIAQPGADLGRVRLRVEGAEALAVEDGALRLTTAAGSFALPLFGTLSSDGRPLTPAAAPSALPGGEVAAPFADPGHAPAAIGITGATDLSYMVRFGGADFDRGNAIAVDSTGAAYIAGSTYSPNFPTTPGAFDISFGAGPRDAFVAKISPAGAIAYATFLGGQGDDTGARITVGSDGTAYVTGNTASVDFPTTPGAFDRFLGDAPNRFDAFAARLNASGSALIYSTYLGGSDDDRGIGIALDASGAIYVTGMTFSPDFPITPTAFDIICGTDGICNGSYDSFLVKLNASGSALIYGSFLGGSDKEKGNTLAVDSSGAVSILAETYSMDFPTTPGAFDRSYNGNGDIVVARMNPEGTALLYATFLGGPDVEIGGAGIAIDPDGATYVVGSSYSENFPTTDLAFDPSYNGDGDAVAVKLNPAGSALVYATFLGGNERDEGAGIARAADGSVSIVLETESADVPTTPAAFDRFFNGNDDLFVTKLNAAGSQQIYATYLGGNDRDSPAQIALDSAGNAYITGHTESDTFPSAGITLQDMSDKGDAFALKLALANPPPQTVQFGALTYRARENAQSAVITVILGMQSAQEVRVNYATSNGTATAGSDYAARGGTLIFAPGQVSKTFSVPIMNDTRDEPDETVRLALSAPVNATLGSPASATLTILDDDLPPNPNPNPGPLYVPMVIRSLSLCNDVENNDIPAEARPMAPIGPVCIGSMQDDPEGEDDWYWINLAGGQTLTIDLTGIPVGADYDLILYDQTGRTVVASSSNLNQADERIAYTSSATARYYMRINMYRRATTTTNTYTLRVVVE